MPSADFDSAVTTAVKARTINNGQSCIAAKRFIVSAKIYDEFERRFVAEMKALRIGDPLEESTDIGPLATPQIVKDLERQVNDAVSQGARILTGGRRLERAGNYYEPTVLVDVNPSTPISCEEIFGPVAMLFRVSDTHEAIRLANSTPFGSRLSAWTTTSMNRISSSTSWKPAACLLMEWLHPITIAFWRYQASGYGRELAEFGIREFVNIKTVWINQ